MSAKINRVLFTPIALSQYRSWEKAAPKVQQRIDDLIDDMRKDPFKGLGKPKLLRGQLKDHWSRRITNADRLVYRVERGTLIILQCRYHY